MRRIIHKGNLPKHLQVLAKELGGRLSSQTETRFYEASSISEFEKGAVDIGYEIIPTVDTETGRGFLVGFDVSTPQRIATLLNYASLQIYYIECSPQEVEEWTKKIKSHREDQQDDMRMRRERARAIHSKNPLKIIRN